MPTPISFTFPDTASLPAVVRGKTFHGGKPASSMGRDGLVQVVRFEGTVINGNPLDVLTASRPELTAQVAAYQAREQAEQDAAFQARRDEIEAAVPGAHVLLDLRQAMVTTEQQHRDAVDRMVERGARFQVLPRDNGPRLAYEAERAANPRAALYVKARRQADAADWTDNTGSGAAGNKAVAILLSGGSIEDAEVALAVRRGLYD